MEAALVFPVLILLILATVDLVNFYRVQMRLDSAAAQLGQVVSQCNTITAPGDTTQFWTYAQTIVGNLGQVSGTGTLVTGGVILSAVYSSSGTNKVAWQVRTGSSSLTSSVGTAGGNATLTEGFAVPSGQTLLVTEVFLPRSVWILSNALMGGAIPTVLNGTTLFLTRAADAPSLQNAPTASSATACTS